MQYLASCFVVPEGASVDDFWLEFLGFREVASSELPDTELYPVPLLDALMASPSASGRLRTLRRNDIEVRLFHPSSESTDREADVGGMEADGWKLVALAVHNLDSWLRHAFDLGITTSAIWEIGDDSGRAFIATDAVGNRVELIEDSGSSPASSSDDVDSRMTMRIHHLCLATGDIDSQLELWRDLLKWTVVMDVDLPNDMLGRDALDVVWPAGARVEDLRSRMVIVLSPTGVVLELQQVEPIGVRVPTRHLGHRAPGLTEICFGVEDTTELENRMRTAGFALFVDTSVSASAARTDFVLRHSDGNLTRFSRHTKET